MDRVEVPRQQRTFSQSEVRQMGRITVETLQKMFADGARLIIEKEPYLTEIDSVIGDGDHGIGMKRGFSAVAGLLAGKSFSWADELCQAVSMELIRSMGGASGVIFGTMFFGGISRLPHKDTVSGEELADYFYEGEQAIERRGRSKPGQKTMLCHEGSCGGRNPGNVFGSASGGAKRYGREQIHPATGGAQQKFPGGRSRASRSGGCVCMLSVPGVFRECEIGKG